MLAMQGLDPRRADSRSPGERESFGMDNLTQPLETPPNTTPEFNLTPGIKPSPSRNGRFHRFWEEHYSVRIRGSWFDLCSMNLLELHMKIT